METYCCICRNQIPESRAWRGSHFCTNDCHRAYRKQRRSWRAEKVCRLCGRNKGKKSQEVAVLTAHRAVHEQLGVS